jgi:hypothetical protein
LQSNEKIQIIKDSELDQHWNGGENEKSKILFQISNTYPIGFIYGCTMMLGKEK